mmetsp:Transcript_23959/g.65745  ORF Transcript_23959/g.65745 Transcript_23959/m.65745 type:complete len:81 (+) Transcript_23959:146-388(+)
MKHWTDFRKKGSQILFMLLSHAFQPCIPAKAAGLRCPAPQLFILHQGPQRLFILRRGPQSIASSWYLLCLCLGERWPSWA